MDDRALFRWGSWAAIIGGVATIALNAVHPRPASFPDPVTNEIARVGESGSWIGIHMGIFAGFLLIAFGLFAVARSMKGGPAEGIARVALGSLLISTPIVLATLLVDGYSLKALADAAVQDPSLAPAAAAGAHLGWGLFMGTALLAVGVNPILFGWAVAADGRYPAWLGWAGVLFGLGGIGAGWIGIAGGSTQGYWVTFTISSGLATLWVIALGMMLGRRAPGAVTIPEGVSARTDRPSRV